MPNLRQMEIVQDVDKLSVDIQEVCMQYKSIKHWAYIIHDKDDTRPHYHIYLHFGNSSVDTSLVAKWFNVPENFINKIKGRRVDMLMYLTHSNSSQQHKHQYSSSEIVANFDLESEIESSKIIGNFKDYSYAQQLLYVDSLPIAEKAKAFSQLQKLWTIYLQCSTLKPDRDIQVIFISGKGGTGKTFYAKKLCEQLNYDFCISSSSNDPFQDYLGQRAMILDDMRDRSFEFEDLLKILDNHTGSSVKSRFSNKVFNGELIIITSSVPLAYWYSKLKSSVDSLFQLYRRINSYVEITCDFIKVYDDGVDETGHPTGNVETFINDLLQTNGNSTERRKISSVFKEISRKGV